ncbi:MAG TPA: LD-carboxypeptidase, partial [Verrucomicrobiae bacterium]|nr:LD-carboxypeptidase [Verrucomicrobiae bacterium]
RLRFGDVVGVLAPASAPSDPEATDRELVALKRLGFKPQLAPNARKRLGFLAGTDKERADDLMSMFADSEVKAIFCLRGGYGSARLLPLLDYRLIKTHPKILLGFSDITSLLCGFLTHAGLVSFHGPTLNTNLTSDKPSPFTLHSLLRTVMEPAPAGSICKGYGQKTVSVLKTGVATGRLVGGNLSVLCATLDTPFEPSFKGRILFFEDVEEAPYHFDRMLTQMLSAGILREVAGIAVGINPKCDDPEAAKTKDYRQTLTDVLRDRLLPLGVPVVTGLPFGHVRQNATLPFGVLAKLDADNGDLIVTEAAVT